jgi:hypothetical protein
MTGPVISPDGKSMWSGKEWILIPPSHEFSLNDSVVQGDVNISSEVHHHHHTTKKLQVSKKSNTCPSCGMQDYIPKRCAGPTPFQKNVDKRTICKNSGCKLCLKQFRNKDYTQKYFCLECYKIHKKIIQRVLWLTTLTITIIAIILIIFFVPN